MKRYTAMRFSTGAAGVMGRPGVWDADQQRVVSYHRTDAKAEAVAATLNKQHEGRA